MLDMSKTSVQGKFKETPSQNMEIIIRKRSAHRDTDRRTNIREDGWTNPWPSSGKT